MRDGNQSWGAEGNVCGERVQSKMCIHSPGSLAILGGGGLFRTPGCRRDTSGRSLHDHFVSKDLSEEKEERQEKAYLGGI